MSAALSRGDAASAKSRFRRAIGALVPSPHLLAGARSVRLAGRNPPQAKRPLRIERAPATFDGLPGLPMTFDSSALISDLCQLEQQIAKTPRHVDACFAMSNNGNQAMLHCAHLEADVHLRALVATTHRIKGQVVPQDGLGRALGSISELVLRGQRRIVLTELDALRDLASGTCAHDRMKSLALGPFEQFEDWLSYVAHEVNGFSQWWIDYREHSAKEREAYRVALRNAHAAMRKLAETSKATPFLRDAVAATDWPALQAPCSRISVALSIQIDVDPDQPLLVFPLAPSESVAERPSQ